MLTPNAEQADLIRRSDDLDQMTGLREQFEGKLQKSYEIAKDEPIFVSG